MCLPEDETASVFLAVVPGKRNCGKKKGIGAEQSKVELNTMQYNTIQWNSSVGRDVQRFVPAA